jgi:hypothetical protein
MNKQQLKVIERAINSEKSDFSLNQTWQDIHDDYAVGQIKRGKIQLTAMDKQQLRELVRCQIGMDLTKNSVSDLNNLHREQVLNIANNEKLAGRAVKQNRIAIKPLPNQRLSINQQHYDFPTDGHLDIALENLRHVTHDSILVIENYRCFDRLDLLNIQLGPRFKHPLVVYRGDKEYGCTKLLQQLKLPVLAMTDIDPAGLMIAQALPYFAALIAPELSVMESYLNAANPHLYSKQLAQCYNALEVTKYPPIRQFWQLIKHHQAGVVQEHWLNDNVELLIHDKPKQTSRLSNHW